MARALAFVFLAAIAAPAFGQAVVTSAAPDAVAVSIYRAPDRASDSAMNLGWLEGYALVTEKRTVEIPQGRATIRFEGVAAGLFPESAIVTGLPSGVREKNLDADLLSPRSLYARMFGRPIILRRMAAGAGSVREERAIIRSGPDGAAIVQTATGFEVANCGGLRDEILYADVPKDLSPRPTLSIETESSSAHRVTLSLSYLAWGFDWQTNYVMQMSPDGKTANLSAWVTLASSDATSFVNADTAVIAGKVNRNDAPRSTPPSGGELVLRCDLASLPPAPPPPPPAPAAYAEMMDSSEIVVTAQRVERVMAAPVTVQQEGLGDLKLYRVPVPVTVAANSQKQVALAMRDGVKVDTFYRVEMWRDEVQSLRQILRSRNRREDGLGLPLPGGPVAVFEPASMSNALLLIGEGGLADRAVGEDVEIELASGPQVNAVSRAVTDKGPNDVVELAFSNARAMSARIEVRIATTPGETVRASGGAKFARKDGRWIGTLVVPPSSERRLRYRIVKTD
ncbi:DUF4139 domain-containing protein [Novosphingobium sp. B1]|uniref:DUF4139 domain-containing protein n=1 Tax=Novosphingobium sp. B1 TaxID=1938756 RepID=UPI0009D829DA|nr:hypothetical protein [Novosphingobium sp. B1]SMC84032.1 hypothetical protein SAMN06272759_108157 [Novosphingobium sp. B1]